jgi:hypothetical protein
MQGVLVGVRIDGNGSDAHLAGRFHDPNGDFTSVGDKNFLEQGTPWGLELPA